jgi:TetR/AcrR family transcriptional regulator, transcriptional repressor for nem operon
MRRSREEKARTRRRIVAAASRLFRARGVQEVSVADVMNAVGLTVGGFYRHFPNKEALVAEAIDAASVETSERTRARLSGPMGGQRPLEAMLAAYLSTEHLNNAAEGCPVAALCSDAGREGRPTRAAFTLALRRVLGLVGEAIPGSGGATRERRLHAVAAAVGGLVLARASDDDRLAQEILSAVRRRVLDENRQA